MEYYPNKSFREYLYSEFFFDLLYGSQNQKKPLQTVFLGFDRLKFHSFRFLLDSLCSASMNLLAGEVLALGQTN